MRWDLVENYAYSSRRRHFSVEDRGEGKARLMVNHYRLYFKMCRPISGRTS